MSLTPHCLREINGKPALDIFVADLVECHKTRRQSSLAKLFRPDSLLGILLAGGDESTWLFAMIHKPGFLRDIFSLPFRRIYSAIMDSGVTCTNRHQNPLKTVLVRVALVLLLVVLFYRRVSGRRMRS